MSDMRNKLLPIFILEAEENLCLLEASITGLEKKQLKTEELTAGFRAAHTIKGTAGLMKLATTSAVAKQLEDTLEQIAEQKAAPAPEMIAAIRLAFTQLKGLVTLISGGGKEPTGILGQVTEAFMAAENGDFPESVQEPQAESEPESAAINLPEIEPVAETVAARVIEPATEATPSPAVVAPQPLSQPDAQPAAIDHPYLEKMTGLLRGGGESLAFRSENVCCTFRLGDKAYYLPISNMVEIADLDSLTFLPMAPGYVRGLISLRGDVVPVIDLGHMYGKPSEFGRNWHLIVAESHGEHLAFLAEGIPNLETEYRGEHLDLDQFIRDYGVKTA